MDQKIERVANLLILLKKYKYIYNQAEKLIKEVKSFQGWNKKLTTVDFGQIRVGCIGPMSDGPTFVHLNLDIPETRDLVVDFSNKVLETMKPKIKAIEEKLDELIIETNET